MYLCKSPLSFHTLEYVFTVSAGIAGLPSGAVFPSSSQVSAFRRAAFRLERSQSQEEERCLSCRKLRLYYITVLVVIYCD